MPLLSVDGITKRFGALVALRDVSLDVNEGTILGLIGPNGAGKTTLFNTVMGRWKPDEGRIFFAGKRIDGKKPFEVCQCGIARTYQLVKPFLTQTVLENVLLAATFGDTSKHNPMERADSAITLVGLDELRLKYVSTLPFIDRRKVELARAISTGAKLVLLDEPMAGLNHSETEQFVEVVRGIKAMGTTVLIIEHVMRVIMTLCSWIVVLDHGEKIAEGTPQQISQNLKVIEAYLGEDKTNASIG